MTTTPDYTKHDARLVHSIPLTTARVRQRNAGWECIVCGAKSHSDTMTPQAALASAEHHNGGAYNR